MTFFSILASLALIVSGCEGLAGSKGEQGENGQDGQQGPQKQAGLNARIINFTLTDAQINETMLQAGGNLSSPTNDTAILSGCYL